MKELVNQLIEKAGLSEEQARKSVDTVLDFVKDKLPAGLSDKAEDLMNGKFDLSSLGSLFGGKNGGSPLDKLKNLF